MSIIFHLLLFKQYFVPLHSMKFKVILILLITMLFSSVAKAGEKSDSIPIKSQYSFEAKQIILPGCLIVAGASSLFFEPMKGLDNSVQHAIMDLRGNNHCVSLDEYLRFTPTVADFALHFSGVKSNYSLTDKLLTTGTSYVVLFALTKGLKLTTHKMRPDGSDDHSFPSGHVATAFLGAEMMRINYGEWWGLAGYSIAGATAFLRFYNNKHWVCDAIGAAGVGILSARIGYWLLPLEKRLLGLDKKNIKTSFVALPTYDATSNALGMSLALQF